MKTLRLGEILIQAGLVTEEQVQHVLETKSPEEKIGGAFIREGLITEQQLIEVLEFQLGIPHINIHQYEIPDEIVQIVPSHIAKRHTVMPIMTDENRLTVAMADPQDYFAIEDLQMATGYQISPAIATRDALLKAISKHYDMEETLVEALDDYKDDLAQQEESVLREDDAPIVRLVNQIITNAVTQQASDIHIDPQDKGVKIRYRIDGVLLTERILPKNMQAAIIARLKIMGNLNITESRIPQDGRIKIKFNRQEVDIRLSTLPAVYGEKVVMRILDLSSALGSMEKIGFTEENLETFRKMITQPNGIILVTGPTGSGKSSTLYSALNYLNEETVNIITVEDPVEYQLADINQVQVNDAVGMTFAAGLRSILRQDPDIVMVGEIRDYETAQISIRASLTGHLVLSTLHTNSAVASLTRLIDMGVEPFLITSSLSGVIAQRLVRRICRDCAKTVELTMYERELFAKSDMQVDTVQKGEGCGNCNNTGYRGRLAIHEVLTVNDDIRQMVIQQKSAAEIHNYAKAQGMKFLVDDGLLKVKQGLTTTDEIIRVAAVH